MVHGMTPVEHLDYPARIELDPGDYPIQPLPDPRRAVGYKGYHIGLGSTHPVQMKRDQLDQRVRALKRAVDDWATSPDHAPFLVHFEKNDNLGLAPLNLELLPFPLAADANVLRDSSTRTRPPSMPTPIRLPAYSLPAGNSPAEPHQIAGAGGQHLGPQFSRGSPDRLLVCF